MLIRKVFDDGIDELLIAFPGMEMTKARAKIWYKYVNYLTDEKWKERIESCIQNCYKNSPVLADILDKKGEKIDISKKYRTI